MTRAKPTCCRSSYAPKQSECSMAPTRSGFGMFLVQYASRERNVWIKSMSSLALSVSMVYMERSMSKQIIDENLLALAHERAVEYLRMIPERPVAPQMTRGELLHELDVPLREEGEAPASVIDSL